MTNSEAVAPYEGGRPPQALSLREAPVYPVVANRNGATPAYTQARGFSSHTGFHRIQAFIAFRLVILSSAKDLTPLTNSFFAANWQG